MNNKNIASTTAIVNALPKLPKMRKGGSGVCLCGCGDATSGGRFRPGHDARLLAWALRVERSVVEQAPAPHTESVAIEVRLRATAGLTGESHAKAQITAADAAGIERKPAKKAAKPRLVKHTKQVADVPVMGDATATGTDGQ